jgi:hypothetical protein
VTAELVTMARERDARCGLGGSERSEQIVLVLRAGREFDGSSFREPEGDDDGLIADGGASCALRRLLRAPRPRWPK